MSGGRFTILLHSELVGGWRLPQQLDLRSELFVLVAARVLEEFGFDFPEGRAIANPELRSGVG